MGNSAFDFGGVLTGFRTDINQTTHGFAVGDILYHNGTIFAKAKADDQATSDVVGIVSAVAGVNDFTLQNAGKISGLSGLTAGQGHFLSPTVAGGLTTTEPSIAGEVSKPVLIADTTTTGILVNFRGITVSAGPGAGGGAWTFVSETSISAVAQVDITGLTVGFDWLFVFQNVLPVTDVVKLEMRTSTDGGSTFDAGASDYADSVSINETSLELSDILGNATGEGFSGDVLVYNPGDATKHTHVGVGAVSFYNAAGIFVQQVRGGKRSAAADVDAARFFYSSGNIASGTIRLYKRSLS